MAWNKPAVISGTIGTDGVTITTTGAPTIASQGHTEFILEISGVPNLPAGSNNLVKITDGSTTYSVVSDRWGYNMRADRLLAGARREHVVQSFSARAVLVDDPQRIVILGPWPRSSYNGQMATSESTSTPSTSSSSSTTSTTT